jgi:trans-aconitate methyltransferase
MNDISKLPKWAQDRIKQLQRQRDSAVDELNKALSEQKPSEIYTDDLICTGENSGPSFKRRYFQANTLHIDHAEIHLSIYTSEADRIALQWEAKGHAVGHVAMVPASFQRVDLIAPEHLRR